MLVQLGVSVAAVSADSEAQSRLTAGAAKFSFPLLYGMDDLTIKEGTAASEQWWTMTAIETKASERAAIADALRSYCKLDSYAMYAIWKTLRLLR